MSLQENMAAYIRAVMKRDNKSFSALSEELGISRNALYGYSTGEGNPSLSTLQQIAEKLGDDPAAIISDMNYQEALNLTLEAARDVKELPEEKRLRFAELFLEMVRLWDQE